MSSTQHQNTMAKATAQPEVTSDTQEAPPSTPVDTTPQAPAEGTTPEATQPENDKLDRQQTIKAISDISGAPSKEKLEEMTDEELEAKHEELVKLLQDRLAVQRDNGTVEMAMQARSLMQAAKQEKRLALLLDCPETEVEDNYKQRMQAITRVLMRSLEREEDTYGGFTAQINGHGLAVETNVGGHTALGVSLVSGKGATQRRSGLGLYLRADHREEAIAETAKALG